jgi:hypothetical protein
VPHVYSIKERFNKNFVCSTNMSLFVEEEALHIYCVLVIPPPGSKPPYAGKFDRIDLVYEGHPSHSLDAGSLMDAWKARSTAEEWKDKHWNKNKNWDAYLGKLLPQWRPLSLKQGSILEFRRTASPSKNRFHHVMKEVGLALSEPAPLVPLTVEIWAVVTREVR